MAPHPPNISAAGVQLTPRGRIVLIFVAVVLAAIAVWLVLHILRDSSVPERSLDKPVTDCREAYAHAELLMRDVDPHAVCYGLSTLLLPTPADAQLQQVDLVFGRRETRASYAVRVDNRERTVRLLGRGEDLPVEDIDASGLGTLDAIEWDRVRLDVPDLLQAALELGGERLAPETRPAIVEIRTHLCWENGRQIAGISFSGAVDPVLILTFDAETRDLLRTWPQPPTTP